MDSAVKYLDEFSLSNRRQGYPSPKNYNPADFYIFTLAIRAGDEEACLQRSKELSDAFSDSHMAQKIKVLIIIFSVKCECMN